MRGEGHSVWESLFSRQVGGQVGRALAQNHSLGHVPGVGAEGGQSQLGTPGAVLNRGGALTPWGSILPPVLGEGLLKTSVLPGLPAPAASPLHLAK